MEFKKDLLNHTVIRKGMFCEFMHPVFGVISSGGSAAYPIEFAGAFYNGDSLTFTPASAGDTKKWTLSFWVKKIGQGINQNLLYAGSGTINALYFDTNEKLQWISSSLAAGSLRTDKSFPDSATPYHVVVSFDSAQAVAADRLTIEVNGVIAVAPTGTDIPLNATTEINSNVLHTIGAAGNNVHGLLSQYAFIDGTIYSATDFGEASPFLATYWNAIDISELTYGTNGSLLDFADDLNMGNDAAPGGTNDWTNSGVTQSTDTPTDNFATMNRLSPMKSLSVTYTENNLKVSNGVGWIQSRATIGNITSGQWYWEFTPTAGSVGNFMCGITSTPAGNISILSNDPWMIKGFIGFANWGAIRYNISNINVDTGSYATYAQDDVVGILLDMDARTISFKKNDVLLVTDFDISHEAFDNVIPSITIDSMTGKFDFGQNGFAYPDNITDSVKALSTANLPEPATAASVTPITAPSFTGNISTDGPFINLGYAPDQDGTSTINGNTIVWGTHATASATGLKIITASTSYNSTGTNTISIAVKAPFKYANGQATG